MWCTLKVLCLFTSIFITRTDFFLISFHPYIHFPPFSSLIQTIKIAFFLTLNMTSHFTLLYWIACLIVFSMILILSGLRYTVSRWSLHPVLQIVKIHWLGNSVVYILPLWVYVSSPMNGLKKLEDKDRNSAPASKSPFSLVVCPLGKSSVGIVSALISKLHSSDRPVLKDTNYCFNKVLTLNLSI